MLAARVLLLAALCAAALAGSPTVDRNLALFPQNGGTFSFTGSGFTRDNPYGQFRFILRNGAGVFVSDPNLFGTQAAIDRPAGVATTSGIGVGVGWLGCMPNTLTVNAAGTVATCTLQYIPDYVIEATGAGTTTLEVDVANGNGYLALTDPTVGVPVATIENINEQIFGSNTFTVPRILHGVTVTGIGFPAAGSLTDVGLFQLDLTTQDIIHTIDVGASLQDGPNGHGRVVLPDLFVTTAPELDPTVQVPDSGTGLYAGTAGPCECYYDRNRIDCGFCTGISDLFGLPANSPTPNSGLTAEITLDGVLGTGIDDIGPTQIAVVSEVDRNNGDVIVDAVVPAMGATNIAWNQPELVLTGSGFATFPALHSNLIVFYDGAASNAERNKCIPTSVNAAGTRLTCRLLNIEPLRGAGTLYVSVIAGDVFSFTANAMTMTFEATLIGVIDTGTQADLDRAIDPRSAPVQADARFLTLTSGTAGFPSFFAAFPDRGPGATNMDTAADPTLRNLVVTLTGIEAAATTCLPRFPFNDVIEDAAADPSCQIVSATNTEIRLRLPPITQPIGTAIEATFLATAGDGTTFGPTMAATTVVGVVAPGAGVGGDPHFFGFLGEKYEFNGVAGEVYNILTDEDVQLNAVIGKWHFTHGEETIIKTLALKTRSHRILIDAGGNHLGTNGFSITLDGKALAPNATEATPLGRDGHVRWNLLTREDNFHLPLWERHNGVAVVEIVLENYRFEVLSVEEGRDEQGVWRKQPSRFLDFMCQMYDMDRQPHGLFGQSAHLPVGKRSVEDWAIQGSGDDYKVSDVFEDDFTFNKFNF